MELLTLDPEFENSQLMVVPNEMEALMENSFVQNDKPLLPPKKEELLAHNHTLDPQMQQMIQDQSLLVLKKKAKGTNVNQSILLKGENYKSKFTVPPVIRSSHGLQKRYNSVENGSVAGSDRESFNISFLDDQKMNIFTNRELHKRDKIDLLDRTVAEIYSGRKKYYEDLPMNR